MEFGSESPYAKTKCPRYFPGGAGCIARRVDAGRRAGPRAHRVNASSTYKGDSDFTHRHAVSPPSSYLLAVAAEQLRLAGKGPAYSALYPDCIPTGVFHDPVFNSENSWNMAANDGWATGHAMGPLTPAL